MLRSLGLAGVMFLGALTVVDHTNAGDERASTVGGLARALLAGSTEDSPKIAARVKALTDADLVKLIAVVRAEFRALADSKGTLTPLGLSGAYELDEVALIEYLYAKELKYETKKSGALGVERKEQLRNGVKHLVAERFKKGSPMVLDLRGDRSFEFSGTHLPRRETRTGAWRMDGGALHLTIERVGGQQFPREHPHRSLELQVLRNGRLSGTHFMFMKETWIFKRE